MISIQTNVNSLVAQQNLSVTSAFQSKTIAQLTSGYRINQSGDDAAGLAVANKFRSTVAELTQGVANGNDATAQLQIMDGGMSNISQILDRLKTLATQSASGTFTGVRATVNSEFQNDVLEIDRQAQSIGLDTGGTFAKSLNVYLGQGSGSASLANAQVTVDLSAASVDSQSLGLKGMQVVAGTADIGTGSATHSVSQIVANLSNTTATAGYTNFLLSGPGFSDNSKIAVSVNLSGVSDINTLVSAINSAIGGISSGTLPASQALKSAGVLASVSTDANGGQELSFSSSTAAFQVQAGDRMANALMGNLTGSVGTAVTSTVTGGNSAVTTTSFSSSGVTVQISGASMAGPVSITFNSADLTVDSAINDLTSQVQNNAALHAAGITVSGGAGSPLVFTSATGESFNVQATGDLNNVLGLGNFNTASTANSPAFYSSIQGVGASIATSGLTNLGFSFDGAASGSAGPTIAGTALTTLNTTGMGATALSLTIDGGTPISIDFSADANKGATETVANVVDYINSSVAAAMGWSSDVKIASVNANNGITLLDTVANASSTMTVNFNATSNTLGLTAGADVTATTAQAAKIAGTALVNAATNVGGAQTLNLVVNGTNVAVAFATDANTGATETRANIIKYINSEVNRQMGWGKDVALASSGAGGITLTDPFADSSSSLTVTQNAFSTALGLGASTVTSTGTGPVGNTVTVNLAGGDAAAATITGSALATGLNTANPTDVTGFVTPSSLVFSVDGTAVTADFTTDANKSTLATYTGGAVTTFKTTSQALYTAAATAPVDVLAQITGGAITANVDAQSGASYTGGALVASQTTAGLSNLVMNITKADGTTQEAINFVLTGGTESATSLAAQINTNWNTTLGNTGTIATVVNGNQIQLNSAGVGAGTHVQVTDNTASRALGLTSTGVDVSVSGTDNISALGLNVMNALGTNTALTVNFTGANQTVANLVGQINTAWQVANTGSIAAVSGNKIVLSSLLNTVGGHVVVTNSTAANALNLNTTGSPITANNLSHLAMTVTDATNGSQVLDVALTGDGQDVNALVSQINTAVSGTVGAIASNVGGKLVLTTNGYGSGSSIAITSNTASVALGLTTGVATAGTSLSNLVLDVTDKIGTLKTVTVNLADLSGVTGADQTSATVAAAINTAWTALSDANSVLETGPIAAGGASGTALTLTSLGRGTGAHVRVTDSTGAEALNLTSSTIGNVDKTGANETVGQIATFLNATTQTALGTSTAANFFTVDNNNKLVMTSQTKGIDSNVTVTAGNLATALGLASGSHNGTGPTMASIVDSLNQDFAANTTLQKAGLQASLSGGQLKIASSNGTDFRLDEFGGGATTLGFGETAGAFTGLTSGLSKASSVDAGGTSAIGTGASTYLSYRAMQFGSDDQAVTISANSTAGALQALTITLRNDETAKNGSTIDAAVSYINSQLQQSNNPTLRGVVAVKENAAGTEMINFLSALPSFSISVGSSANGNGINAGVAQKFASVMNGSASSIAVDTQDGAKAAVTALAAAVGKLGAAQAAIGRGENQLSYAISLAQSQITNFSAAESQIRDANVAQQAANLSKAQVLSQASIAAMAQANSAPQAVLSLLRG